MDVMIISATSAEEARAKIEAGITKLNSILGPASWNPKKRGFVPGAQASFAVVIDGDTLRFALDENLKSLFLNLATRCETVVCCRVSPAQKALTVKLVRPSPTVLCKPNHFGAGEGREERNDSFHW